MQTVLSFIIQFVFISFASGGIFIASSLVSPIKAVVSHPESHIPRMSIRFDEFDPAFAALEDDYYVGEYEDEKIPTNIAAKELKPGDFEITPAPAKHFELPAMTMNASREPASFQGAPASTWKAASDVAANKLSPTPEQLGPQTFINDIRLPHYWIQGKMELTQGLAISDPKDELRVGWFVDGEKIRDGKINLNAGTYEIKIDRMEGELIAELVNRQGYVIGEALLDLEILQKQRLLNEMMVSNVDLMLAPYMFGANGQTVSVYHTPTSRSPVASASVAIGDHDIQIRTGADGKFHEEAISAHSTAVLAANQASYRESILISDLEKHQTLKMLPEKFLRNFFDIIELDKSFREQGVIWGTIRKDDVPAQGHRVRLAAHPEVPAVYFTYYIPDDKRKDTSIDGQFSFVGLVDGEYEVEVINALDQKIDSKLVVVRAGSVSPIEFDVGLRKTIYVKPFDPLTQSVQGLQFAAMGSSSVSRVQTEQQVAVAVTKGDDPILLQMKLENGKVESNTFASRSRKVQDVPVLNTNWWAQIQSQYQIAVKAGAIVGFIDSDAPFKVYNEDVMPGTKILYFNQSGQIIKQDGQKPSGFVIYNTGHGVKTLVIEADTGLLTTEAAYVDGESVSLIYKSL